MMAGLKSLKLSILLLFGLFTILIGVQSQDSSNIVEKYFEQKLDHENNNNGIWRQRYLENRQFFKPGSGSPIFLYYGGPSHSPFNPSILLNGSMVTYASQLNANLIALESRYYGRSRPTADLSVENLSKYLTYELIRDDYAEFALWLKKQPEFENSKIVGFGSGFYGSHVSHVMKRHTGAIDMGVISSAPVEFRFEVPEYAEKTVELLTISHPECYASVHDTIVCFEKIAQGERCQGHVLADLKDMFDLCGDINPQNEFDVSTLRLTSLRSIAAVIFTNNPDPEAPYNTEKMCRVLGDHSKNLTHFERLAREIHKIHTFSKQTCIESRFDTIVQQLASTSWEHPAVISGQRQMNWFRCSQAAMIRTPAAFELEDKGKFAVTATTELCHRLFNITAEQMQQNSQETNKLLGSRHFPEKCGIFVSGTNDLFQNVSVTSQSEVGDCNRVYLIEGASFAKNTGEIQPEGSMSYPPALRMTQTSIGSLIGEWLASGNCCIPSTKELYQSPPDIFDLF